MRWLVADSLYNPEAYTFGHLDSYAHYLREAGETVETLVIEPGARAVFASYVPDVLFALDNYAAMAADPYPPKRIAQVAAICSPMPWDVRKPDGSPVYDCVISSIPWMVEAARAAGCRGEYMALAFDSRARVCGMGIERTRDCIFIGTVGPNHQRRAQVLEELRDVVEVLPPVFGREYFRTLASAKVVLNIHAEWAKGAANNMRMFETEGMGTYLVTDGHDPIEFGEPLKMRYHGLDFDEDIRDARGAIVEALALSRARGRQLGTGQPSGAHGHARNAEIVLAHHTYESRIPRLIELARSL